MKYNSKVFVSKEAEYCPMLLQGHRTWDSWILKEDEIYRLFYLTSDCTITPFWSTGMVGTAISPNMKDWTYLGIALEADPKCEWGNGRMLAGNVYKDNGTYYLFYSASPLKPLILYERIGLATSSDGLSWQRQTEQLLEPDDLFYGVSRPFSELEHRQCRDPYIINDPETGLYYMFFSASSKEGDFNFRGCVGLAVANKIDGPYKILPPAIYPEIDDIGEGIFYEIERPQVIHRNKRYYLFFSCWQHMINPKWIEKVGRARIRDSSLYCYVSDEIAGPFQPWTEKPIVHGSENTGLYGTNLVLGPNGEFFAYGWYPNSFTLEVSPRFPVRWKDDFVEISLNQANTEWQATQEKVSLMKSNKTIVPKIYSVPESIKKPFWSIMIPTHNCASYLVQTLQSVLIQDLGEEMQIEVVDDCSTKDDPEAVVKELGKGRVSFFRQPQNVGATANFNTCIQLARGQWVHIIHGDDTVLPGFYNCLQEALEKEPTAKAAFCRHIYMNEEGHWHFLSRLERNTPGILENWIERISIAQLIQFPSIVVKRSVYEELGGFHPELIHAADWEMWKRIAANYPVWYETQPLACYRTHSTSDSSRLVRTGINVADTRRAIEISQSYLPVTIAAELTEQARENCAFQALNTASRMLTAGDVETAMAQIREGIKSSQSPNVIVSALGLVQELVRSSEQYDLQPIDILEQFGSACQELLQQHHANTLIENLKLKETNLIVFPDWKQPEELLHQELGRVVTNLVNQPDKSKITLLINLDYLPEYEANLFLSEVAVNLFLEEDLDVANGPEISLLAHLKEEEWEALLPRIQARVAIKNENQHAIIAVKAENIPVHQIESLSELVSVSI